MAGRVRRDSSFDATSRLTPHHAPNGACALLHLPARSRSGHYAGAPPRPGFASAKAGGESGECVACASSRHAASFPRCVPASGLCCFPLRHEGVARRSAQTLSVRVLARRGAFRRATCARAAHVICSVYATPGPAFRCRLWPGGQSAPDRDSHLVVPGGAPMSPECLACVSQARRRRTPSRRHERLARAPSRGRGACSVSAVSSPGTSSHKIHASPPGLSRGPTRASPGMQGNSRCCWAQLDGRDKPGHDEIGEMQHRRNAAWAKLREPCPPSRAWTTAGRCPSHCIYVTRRTNGAR
jgi:hypothetical protein